MYKNPENFNKMKKAFFDSFQIESLKCLEPSETCNDTNLINSHSIQDSRILECLAMDNHIVQIVFDSSCVGKSTMNSIIPPHCKFDDKCSIHKASTFVGLCNKHDTEIFKPIDTENLDMNNSEHVFLLTYRSIFKEMATLKKVALMHQFTFLSKADLKEIEKDVPTEEGIVAFSSFAKSYDFHLYKKLFDQDYLSRNYNNISWKHLTIDSKPTFAVSSVFTPLEISLENYNEERICVNIFPYNNKMHVLFSCRKEDEKYMDSYIFDIFNSSGEYQKYLISKLVLRNCENLVISPAYFKTWSEEKKKAVLQYFEETLYSDLIDFEDSNLFLF